MAELYVQKKKNNNWLIWLIVAIVLLIAIYYFYVNYYQDPQVISFVENHNLEDWSVLAMGLNKYK